MHFTGLNVFVVDACVADVGVSQGDNLAAVARIGQDFLITRHGGVKNNLGHTVAIGANRLASEDSSVCQG